MIKVYLKKLYYIIKKKPTPAAVHKILLKTVTVLNFTENAWQFFRFDFVLKMETGCFNIF